LYTVVAPARREGPIRGTGSFALYGKGLVRDLLDVTLICSL